MEATGHLIGSKIVNENKKISNASEQSNSETVTNEHDKEISKEIHISPDKRHKLLMRLI